MAYDKTKIFEQAKDVIVKHKLFFIDDIIAFLPISSSTFYAWEMEKSEDLKELLHQNRTELKVSMRSKWYKSNAPALQMALMKLIATPEELRKLSMQHVDHTTKGEQVNIISLGAGNKPK
tara:strand:- start:138 stop:497 length:360 start_codon:yes stop_codon:yes gene_type:complete